MNTGLPINRGSRCFLGFVSVTILCPGIENGKGYVGLTAHAAAYLRESLGEQRGVVVQGVAVAGAQGPNDDADLCASRAGRR